MAYIFPRKDIFYQDFFGSASRIGHISSPCALPPERMTKKSPSYCVYWGRLLLSCRHGLGRLVRTACAAPPSEGCLVVQKSGNKDLCRTGQHFSLPVPPLPSLSLFVGFVWLFFIVTCVSTFANSFILSRINFST